MDIWSKLSKALGIGPEENREPAAKLSLPEPQLPGLPKLSRTRPAIFEDTKGTSNSTSGTEVRTPELMPREVYQGALGYMKESPPPAFMTHNASLDDLKNAIERRMKLKVQTDFTPLAALADTWSRKPSNLAKSMPKVESAEDTMTMDAKLYQALAKERDDQATRQLQFLQSVTPGYQGMKLGAAMGAMNAVTNRPPGGSGNRGMREEDLMRAVRDYDNEMKPYLPMIESFKNLDKAVGGYKNWSPGKDIPGTGATGWLPTALLSGKGAEVKQAYNELLASVGYLQSGKALTAQEANRLRTILGGGKFFASDRDLITAMQRFAEEQTNILHNRQGRVKGVKPKVIEFYEKGGGISPDVLKNTGGVPADAERLKQAQELQRQMQDLRKQIDAAKKQGN
jgi:hypothetical protein